MLTIDEVYNKDAWYRYNISLAYDFTEMLTFKPCDDIKTIMLIEMFSRTYRNFQEPALRYFNIPKRTKLIKIIRNVYYDNLNAIMIFKLTNNRWPKDTNEIEAWARNNQVNNQWNHPLYSNYNCDVREDIPNIEAIASIFEYTSIYEWLSMFCNDENNSLNFYIAGIKNLFENLNNVCKSKRYGVRVPFKLEVTTHQNLLDKLVHMGEKSY